jgi:hypothetical protein
MALFEQIAFRTQPTTLGLLVLTTVGNIFGVTGALRKYRQLINA